MDSKSFRIVLFASLLILLLVLLGWKYKATTAQWSYYAMQLRSSALKYPTLDSQEDAQVIATTITTLPSVNNPLYKQPSALESYITTLGKQTHRDIVIVDKNKKILADTLPENVGTHYTEDKRDEVGLTISRGLTHVFVEKGRDFPHGLNQTVIPWIDPQGTVLGAIIISDSTIFER